jgi:uncharacterized integral membrane protein
MTDNPSSHPIQADNVRADAPSTLDPYPDRSGPPTEPAAANPLRRSRASTLWVGVVVFAGVLVLLLIFILQNTQPVEVSYFGFAGTVPLAVAMLLAAIAGVLLAATAGALRIFQLRRRVPRSARH